MVKDAVPRMRVVDGGGKPNRPQEQQAVPPSPAAPSESSASIRVPLLLFLLASAIGGAALAWARVQGVVG